MKVAALYCYPVKSLRGIKLDEAYATRTGFLYDRRFMLQKVLNGESEDQPTKYKNMTIASFGKMSLFKQRFDSESAPKSVIISYTASQSSEDDCLEIPLEPSTAELEEHHISLQKMDTRAFRMGVRFEDWFSARFGYRVALIYIGSHHRTVRGNINPEWENAKSWPMSILQQIPVVGPRSMPPAAEVDFADVAACLVTTEESLKNVSDRLPAGEIMDMTKFRPNIVLSGSPGEWDEDWWAEVEISPHDAAPINFVLTANCGRCNSINVDYTTGKTGTGASGRILDTLRKDRCVDPGQKYSPVFGRYGFLTGDVLQQGGALVAIGDEAKITQRRQERFVLDI